LALAARTVILTAEEIVEKLDQVDVIAPLVKAVAHAPHGAWPTSCHPLYPVGGGELLRYLEACGRESFSDYLKERLEQQP
ncbi:MAG: CoA transferase subunit A, partial [Anaerolineales bacterium]